MGVAIGKDEGAVANPVPVFVSLRTGEAQEGEPCLGTTLNPNEQPSTSEDTFHTQTTARF